jgi:TAP-like protein
MKQGIVDADGTLAGFYSGCVATPERCALARHGSTAEGLANQINNLIKAVKYNPMPVKTEKGNGLITYEMVKSVIFQALYDPGVWIELSTNLHNLLSGNLTGFWDAYTAGDEGGDEHDDQEEEENIGTDANVGIRCGDAHILPPNNLDALKPELTQQEQMSEFAGDLWPSGLLDCARWKIHAKEQYSGNFHAKTKFPLLFVGNTHDPVTPYASAVNASAGFEGSVVLKHDAYGHCSIAQPSVCTSKAIQAYFVNGTVPAPGTVCQPTIQLFSNITVKEAFTSISLDGEPEPEYDPLADDNNDVNIMKRDIGVDEDAELLAALMGLSKKIPRFTGIY